MKTPLQILEPIAELLKRKDVDYGGAFWQIIALSGAQYAADHILEKALRIHALTRNGSAFYESLEDALRDCIGYCTKMLQWLDEQKTKD